MAEEAAKWGGASIEVPPPFLEPIITAINDTLELLVVFLDIVLIIIEICKVFVLGLLSPMLAILDALIALVESLANDLRKAGLYLRGDWDTWVNASDWKAALQELEGGYGAFEARAFNWLIDSTDPSRPDFSTASGVLGLFFYMGVDYSDLIKAYNAIMGLVKFFSNVGGGKFLQTPADVKYEFVSEFGFGGNLKDHWESPDSPPTRANLTWGFSASPAKPYSMPLTPLPPECCIVEISTFPGGWWPGYSRPQAGGTGPAGKKENGFIQAPIEVGGGPLRIFGGSACLVKDKQYLGTGNGPVTTPAGPGQQGVWLVKGPQDKEPVYLNELIKAEASQGGPIGQKQHVIHMNAATRFFFPEYKFKLVQEEMPYAIKSVASGKPTPEDEPARDVWVSIASGGEGVGHDGAPKWMGDEEKNEGQSGFEIINIANPAKPVTCRVWPEPASRSRSSQEIKISFPSDAKKKFMQMVQNAAVIALLCRGDLDAESQKEAPFGQAVTNFLPLAGKLNKALGGIAPWSDWSPGIESRTKLAVAANAIAEEFTRMSSGIPEAVFEGLVEQHSSALLFPMEMLEFNGTSLFTADGSDVSKSIGSGVPEPGYMFAVEEAKKLTIYEHCNRFNTFSEATPGVHMMRLAWCWNFKSALDGCNPRWATDAFLGIQAATYSIQQLDANMDNVPVFVGMKKTAMSRADMAKLNDEQWVTKFREGNAVAIPARNLFSKDVLNSALTVLNVATRLSSEGKWIVIRPLDTFLQPVEEFIEKLLQFLKGLREGLLAIIQQILNYIKMIESRIMQIQQLIRRIQGILRMLSDFKISADFQMLVVTGAGTQGLISEFMTAESKPDGGPEEVGHGAVVVAGGLPLVILDLIKAIIAAKESSEGGGGGEEEIDAAALLADEGV